MNRLLRGRAIHLGWATASAFALAVAFAIDPYVFAIGAVASFAISAAFVAATFVVARRGSVWALAGCVPTLVALARLASIRWA